MIFKIKQYFVSSHWQVFLLIQGIHGQRPHFVGVGENGQTDITR
jgi:hypothetical protein